jgi:hypothetical protein
MVWSNLLTDNYRSPQFDELHARLDNYQVYSVVWCDLQLDRRLTRLEQGFDFAPTLNGITNTIGYTGFFDDSYVPDIRAYNRPPSRVTESYVTREESPNAIAYQSFCPLGKIDANFGQLAIKYPVTKPPQVDYKAEWAGGFVPIERRWIDSLGKETSDYRDLVMGNKLDARVIPKKILLRPTSTRQVAVSYYRRNLLETHPKLLASLDWERRVINLTKSVDYFLDVSGIILGGLFIDDMTKAEIVNVSNPNFYPVNYLFADNLDPLFTEWNTLYPSPDPPRQRPIGVNWDDPNGWVIPDADAIVETNWSRYVRRQYSERVTSIGRNIYTSIVTVLAANNDRWKHGTNTRSLNYPNPEHSIFNFDYESFFEAIQTDGSYGSQMTDSPRIMEIHQALDAGKYATYADTSGAIFPRVANLGHLIEKICQFIGYRPEPNGSIDIQKEKTTYAAAVVKDDFVGGKDYHPGRFGGKGMLLRRVTNRLGANGKWESGGIVKVHDLIQLATELFGEINQAVNLQDSTSISIKDGDKSYSYPNTLALLVEIGTGVIQQRRQVREAWASSIVTQKTANEILSGLGLPVVSKSLLLNGQQLPYWGIQPNQSLQKEIATSAYQGGAQLGQLL